MSRTQFDTSLINHQHSFIATSRTRFRSSECQPRPR